MAPQENWTAVAAALTVRMATMRISQQQLAAASGISVATIRVLQRGIGNRRVQDSTLVAISTALDWPAEHLLEVLLGQPALSSQPFSVGGLLASTCGRSGEIVAVLLRIEQHLETIARHLSQRGPIT
ncbi:hypothetical protein BL253_35110 [Pseudofrankia asymbiotica]|uniref:HTH cro/C1-type domain-containing protein n=2 Tax=Pseudofrankia asymbiotica TaxID=1834516 RepID=A0A1V2I0B8_9ACTN|nr:hypothetical protein BL253_35110 [Pseudofrankia asymbiotica]